ncbi:unnamed protein product [Rhizophagus irregularis]|nr:unnamed protein product [Rhizophagus irregularis]
MKYQKLPKGPVYNVSSNEQCRNSLYLTTLLQKSNIVKSGVTVEYVVFSLHTIIKLYNHTNYRHNIYIIYPS